MAKKKYYQNTCSIARKASGGCGGWVQPEEIFESSKDLSKEYWAKEVDSKEAKKLFSKEEEKIEELEEEKVEELDEVNSLVKEKKEKTKKWQQ